MWASGPAEPTNIAGSSVVDAEAGATTEARDSVAVLGDGFGGIAWANADGVTAR
jgi:hypothetical protein